MEKLYRFVHLLIVLSQQTGWPINDGYIISSQILMFFYFSFVGSVDCTLSIIICLKYLRSGFSHRDCAISSAISTNEEVEFVILCKRCYNAKALAQNEIRNESPTTPLNLPMQEYRNLVTVTKGSISNHRAQDTHETKQITSDPSLSTKSRRRTCSWGIIWKKKNSKDTGTNFRQNNILLSGGANVHRLEPVCHLCRKPYRSDLMYVCCETCKSKFSPVQNLTFPFQLFF